MAFSVGKQEKRRPRICFNNRHLLQAIKGIKDNEKLNKPLPDFLFDTNASAQISENAKVQHSNQAENSKLQNDKSDKSYEEDFKKLSGVQNSGKDSINKVYNDKKQNHVVKKDSFDSEAEVTVQEDCTEFSGVKHQRHVLEPVGGGLKISFENDLQSKSDLILSNVNSPPASEINISSLSAVPSLPSVNNLSYVSSAYTPTITVCSSPSSTSSSLLFSRTQIVSLSPVLPPVSCSSLSLRKCSHLSGHSNSTNFNNVHALLPLGEGCFIPPPVLPSTINDTISSDTSSEKKTNSFSNGLDSTGDLSYTDEDENFLPITDPDHLEAITNYILTVVKERSVNSSSAIKVVRDLNLLFKNFFEGNFIEVYGSYYNDLAITTSDINLVVIADISVRKSFMFEVYKVLAKELEKYHVHPFEEGISAHQTKVNFSHPETGINCVLAYLGRYKENIFNMGKFLKLMTLRDNRVKTLIIATKIWIEYLSINEVEDGKLHPIGYALLVIHFLQHCENPVLPMMNGNSFDDKNSGKSLCNTSSVGELWMGFLRYFSIFNWKQNVVTVNSKEIVSKKSKHWENYWIAIEDPYTGKNIAESVINSDVAEYIKACFKSSYAYFCNPPQTIYHNSNNGICQSNGKSSNRKYEFSFQRCIVEQNETFCDKCEEIDDVCDDCKKKIYVQPMASVPKMTDSFLNKIKSALMLVYNKYILSEDEINERKQFVKELQTAVCKVYPDVHMNLFGSSTNGFGFKNSDLDICISFKTKKINSASILRNIRFLLRKKKGFNHVVAIFNAHIPIIKFHYEPKGWRGDISLDNTLAVHNSELLRIYSLVDERCKILGCALKLLAKKALVAEVTEKALSSYSYLNMVIHFLQQVEPPVLPVLQDNEFRENKFTLNDIVENCNVWFCKDLNYIRKIFKTENVASVEQLWIDLLDFYCSFDNNRLITIRQKEIQYMNEARRCARLFNIQDPFIETKNLGCVVSAKKAQETKSVFNRARCLFRTPVKELPSGVKDIEDYFFSTMSLTGRIHKEALCNLCGKFGHEQKECKQSYFPLQRPHFRHFQKYNSYRNRNIYKNPMNRPAYKTQFSS